MNLSYEVQADSIDELIDHPVVVKLKSGTSLAGILLSLDPTDGNVFILQKKSGDSDDDARSRAGVEESSACAPKPSPHQLTFVLHHAIEMIKEDMYADENSVPLTPEQVKNFMTGLQSGAPKVRKVLEARDQLAAWLEKSGMMVSSAPDDPLIRLLSDSVKIEPPYRPDTVISHNQVIRDLVVDALKRYEAERPQ
ncbi:hypothetical protein BC832DRAFT_287257 [Gaertneriomyces semiglobifer]|nr:hypothetical protein BC832DRAFT_287257 [Gaertneriomyces semiglobifer]